MHSHSFEDIKFIVMILGLVLGVTFLTTTGHDIATRHCTEPDLIPGSEWHYYDEWDLDKAQKNPFIDVIEPISSVTIIEVRANYVKYNYIQHGLYTATKTSSVYNFCQKYQKSVDNDLRY